ncbi:MAG: protoheme IX farnesyltransferase, partial [Methylotenera sp.]|nr:protoheme IX farnesyltransferase [Methylotenera sp.]
MTSATTQTMRELGLSFKNFFSLCKPRVTSLIVFTALIGMFLATPGMVPWPLLLA